VCDLLDGAFAAQRELRERFAKSPAAQGGSARTLITHVRDRPGHDRRYAVDARKIRERLGFVPGKSLSAGLKETVSWYLEHEPWWRAVVSGEYRDWYARQYRTPSSA
jgi:dTDP-glucose 4,6-dehydratase